jgi:putative spermidine/putrescine transport system permease protein
LARTKSRWRTILLVLAIAPLLTADVVRVYGWLVILSPSGLVNSALLAVGVIQQPLTLVYNQTGAFIGLVEILMPYAILTLFSALVSYDPSLEEAAMSLGGTRTVTFLRVTLPLSLPVIALTSLLLFVLTISSYVTPSVLGGGRVFLIATEIYRQASLVINWPLASALGVILLVGAAIVLIGYGRLSRAIEARVRG